MRTIKGRLTLWYMLLLFLTLFFFSAITYVGVSRSVLARFDQTMAVEVANFAQESEIEDDGELDLESEVFSHGERVSAYDPGGQVIARVGLPLAETPGRVPSLGFDRVVENGVPWRRLTVEAPSVGLVLQVSRSREEVERSLTYMLWFLVAGVPLTTLLAGAGGLFLASRLLNPLNKITRTAASLSASELSQRLPRLETEDELSRLIDTFNGMLGRLEDAFARQKQFTSDAAHELRTPLALLLARAEVTLSRPRSQAEYEESLRELREGIVGMTALVTKLLTLARADSGNLLLERERLDLADLVGDAASAMQALHPQTSILTALNPAPVAGDQTRLTELILILLDNALKFTPAGGEVNLSVFQSGGEAVMTIRDSGPGISPADRERIFERFFQADPARTGGHDSGAGLGLPIGRAIARQHGGELALEGASEGAGAVFVLRLPLAR